MTPDDLLRLAGPPRIPHDPRPGRPAPLDAPERQVRAELIRWALVMRDAWATGNTRDYTDARAARSEWLP